MRRMATLAGLLLAAGTMQAQTLSFTAGAVSGYDTVVLTLQGPTNQWVQVERLNRTSQVWQVQGTLRLGGGGTGSFTNALHQGVYGYFRAQTTNGTVRSTNAFGAVAGYLYPGYNQIGNPFPALGLTNIFPTPTNGLTVYQYTTNGYTISTYDPDWGWEPNLTIVRGEGFIVWCPTNQYHRYLVSGLFTTNALVRSLPAGYSMLCSPLYRLLDPANGIVDRFTTNKLGGDSLVPVQTSGYDPQSTVLRMVTAAGGYETNVLRSFNVWQKNGLATEVPLELTEGFWLNKPTNATWTVSVPIW